MDSGAGVFFHAVHDVPARNFKHRSVRQGLSSDSGHAARMAGEELAAPSGSDAATNGLIKPASICGRQVTLVENRGTVRTAGRARGAPPDALLLLLRVRPKKG